jgi:hypothetical protein
MCVCVCVCVFVRMYVCVHDSHRISDGGGWFVIELGVPTHQAEVSSILCGGMQP